MKNFTLELQDLYPSSDFWTIATVYYEGEDVCEVEDEFGRTWALNELSIFDLNRVYKFLVQELAADREEAGRGADSLEVWQ